jgi:hypothetical protein
MTDEDEPLEHTCGQQPVTPQKFSFWFLTGMMFNLMANIGRSCVGFCEEVGHSLYAHGLHRQNKQADVEVVDTFRDQLTKL